MFEGVEVIHKKWGKGIIQEVNGDSVKIKFKDEIHCMKVSSSLNSLTVTNKKYINYAKEQKRDIMVKKDFFCEYTDGKTIENRIKKKDYKYINSIQLDKHGHPDGESSIVFCLKSNGKFDFEERQALLFKDYEYEIKREVYDGLIEYLMEYVKKWKEIYSAPILDGLSWELRIRINYSDIVRS